MNKLAKWIKDNGVKQCAVAMKVGVGNATLHDILREKYLPSLKTAYEIEKYTHGAVTVYDWLDASK